MWLVSGSADLIIHGWLRCFLRAIDTTIPSSVRRVRSLSSASLHHRFTMADRYPEVQGGGSLILAWQVRNKRVLVVGGGEVGACALPPSFSQC